MDTTVEVQVEIPLDTAEPIILRDWLSALLTHAPETKYWHLLCQENYEKRANVTEALVKYVNRAHEDARERLRSIEGYELDPYGNSNIPDPAAGYPKSLNEITLMGYFGEILTGLMAHEFDPFGISRWEVPAHLFRYHMDEFRHLEKIRQGHSEKGKKSRRVGRTGDDCLAFVMDREGNITHGLFCEAKCLQKSNPKSIKEAHKKLNDPNLIPLDRQQLIEVLLDSRRPDKDKWILALRQLGQAPVISYSRMNMIGYISTAPKTKRRNTWIMPDKPHPEYKDSHDLQVIEVHIPNILSLVKQVYGK